MRVWFNKTFSSIHAALRLIRGGDRSAQIELFTTGANPHAPARLVADHFEVEPSELKGQAYLQWCLDYCRRYHIDILVPGKEAALITEHQALFAQYRTRILYPAQASMLELIHNKHLFYKTAHCAQAPSPESLCTETLEEFDQAFADLSARHEELCIKPSVGVYGMGFRRIRTDITATTILLKGMDYQVELQALRFVLGQSPQFSPMLVMEYLNGVEYSVDCLSDQGELKCAIARQKSDEAGHGQQIDSRADIQSACHQLVKQFELNGFSNIQFREGTQGLKLLEINPRMSGGIAMSCLAGPNLPYLGLMGFSQGYDQIKIPPVCTGLRVGELNFATKLL